MRVRAIKLKMKVAVIIGMTKFTGNGNSYRGDLVYSIDAQTFLLF